MSVVRVWIKKETEEGSPFKEFRGVEIRKGNNGEWYTEAFELDDPIPNFLLEHITRVSLYKTIPYRELGLYGDMEKYGETMARVDHPSKPSLLFSLKINGHGLEHVRGLHDAILAGEIRPHKSFTGRQLGLSKQELEEKVEQLESKCGSYAFFEVFFDTVKRAWLDDDKRWFLNGRAFRKQLGELIAMRPEK